MPVRLRSRSSMAAMIWRLCWLRSRSSSSSVSTPRRMTPGSEARAGGSSAMRCFRDARERRRARPFRRAALQAGGRRFVEEAAQQRDARQRLAQRHEDRAAWPRPRWRGWPGARGPARREILANLFAQHGVDLQLGDGVEPRGNFVAINFRPQNPGAQQPRTHAGGGFVERARAAKWGRRFGAREPSSANSGAMSSRLRTVTGSSTSASCCS